MKNTTAVLRMNIINLTKQEPSIHQYKTSFALNLQHSKEIWLFNCHQGCQHNIKKQKIKINYISKIIIANLNLDNISGLLGLLSSLSLINRKNKLHIYSPAGLQNYLKLGKKYSQTNFRYNIYFYTLTTGLIVNHQSCQIYTFANKKQFDFLLISREQLGKLKLLKATEFNLTEGPLYGKLKKGADLILPDGLILNSKNFTNNNKPGIKQSFISSKYNKRSSIETTKNSKTIYYYV